MTTIATPEKLRKRKAQLVDLIPTDDNMVTLTKLPANRAGFKIRRSEEEDDMLDIDKAKRGGKYEGKGRKRKKRTDTGLLSLVLPTDATQETADEIIEKYGLTEDYELQRTDDGTYVLVRRGADMDIEFPTHIQLGGGIVAQVDPAVFARGDTSRGGVTLVRIDFDGKDVAEVKTWLDEFGVDYPVKGVEQVDGGVIVTRHDHDGETKRLRLAEGVTGYVARAEQNDVPVKLTRTVVDLAFGQWGWGHLDFGAALADPEFSMQSENALFALRDVLENVIFYSGLPLDERKTLIQSATDQFATFMSNLIDTLPTQVLDVGKQARAEARKEESSMATKDQDAKREDGKPEDQTASAASEGDETKRDDEGSEEKTALEAAAAAGEGEGSEEAKEGEGEGAAATSDDDTPVTRGEVQTMVTEAVTAAVEPVTKRADEHGETLKTLQETVARSAEAVEKLANGVGGLQKSIEDIGGETVARSDDGDDEGGVDGLNDEQKAAIAKRAEDPFSGMFGRTLKRFDTARQ